jgi:hypothetical protein
LENYLTLFDHKFLPQGLALYASLQAYASPCRLWVVCMDDKVEAQLQKLNLPHLRAVPLREVEDEELRAAKAARSWTEYCWTLTPAICLHVLQRDPTCARVTYVDADLAFFKSPAGLFADFERSGKQVQITEHAFAPQYAHMAAVAGRFCVQFQTFNNQPDALAILRRWRTQCLEDCTAKADRRTGAFGDQKYVAEWPEKYGSAVHILTQTAETLAPWNVDHYQELAGRPYFPVIYHFHSFRIHAPTYVRLSSQYVIRRSGHLYDRYLELLDEQVRLMKTHGLPLPVIPLTGERHWFLRTLKRYLFQHLVLRRHRFPIDG